ncbi:glycerophosphodiester phosphodiesterase family protein [Methylocella tundrae]
MSHPLMRAAPVNAPDWLTERPVAHRGLHSKARGVIENTVAAAEAAIARCYAIECDIQLAGDGEAVVFHDFTLPRLTHGHGRVDGFSAQELMALRFKESEAKIAPLSAFLAAVAGRTPLIIEVKSRFDGDLRLAERALAIASAYAGPAALKSFDPDVLAFFRAQGFAGPIGLVAQARYEAAEWPELGVSQRLALAALSAFSVVRPDFLSWHVGDLPHATPELCRGWIGMPVLTWTVRSPADRHRAQEWADQMIFEGFEP